jgi:DNA-binding NtrC family response regulator
VAAAVAGTPRVDRKSGTTWHEQVRAFKRDLLTAALERSCGNRTHAARALGLQRTHLMRLVRELEITVPPPARGRGRA